MKIKLGQCKCGSLAYLVEEVGIKWVGDMEPLDADGATGALLAGRELFRIRYVGSTPTDLSTAKPDVLRALLGEPGERPVVVQSHGCPSNDVSALLTGYQRFGGPGPQDAHPKAPVAPSRPFSGPRSSSSTPDSVQGAETQASDQGENDEAIWIIQSLLGATVL